MLTLYGRHSDAVPVDLPRFDVGETEGGGVVRRGVPAIRFGDTLVTTVFDLLMARYAVARAGLPGDWPSGGYGDASAPGTPAWQERITSVPAAAAARVAREFARSAELSRGRSMICMGAGTNHWYHSDQIYRTFFTLIMLCGCEGVNGGGWAHYVGQEKVRPFTGWQQMAFALDWQRPTRHMTGTSFFYTHTDQWRYEAFGPAELASPLGRGVFAGRTFVDCLAEASRMGWTPSHPAFDRNPLDLADEAAAAGQPVPGYVVDELKAGRLRWAAEDPDAPENWPRVMTIWRANVLGSSGKGMEYFMRHLLGSEDAVRAQESPEGLRPAEVTWREEAPRGKLDLLTTIDFRMTSSCTYADIVLPAATWYEKHDISTTDMHPFVHSFNPAIPPPWEARTDFDAFMLIAREFSRLAQTHLGTRTDVIAAPLMHDTPDELAQPGGAALDWARGECEPVPGVTMPRFVPIERDYTQVAEKMAAVGPLIDTLGTAVKGAHWVPSGAVDYLRRANGVVRGGAGDGRPSLERDVHMAEAILALSGTTNGRVAVQAWESLEQRTGVSLADLAAERAGEHISFYDIGVQPRSVITSPEWSGSETGGRRYAPFTVNVERKKPWHTLTGRMHFFLDHDWMHEYGEALPVYRPPLNYVRHFGEQGLAEDGRPEITVRYLTPHSKWSIHSEYQDNLHMLRLFRGGPVIWMSPADAATIGVADNDWIEAYNRNGVVACRAVVTHRMPQGTVFMYHAKDRHLMTPKSEVSGWHGGADNSLTRLVIKPTHMIGGYGQQTFQFNYHGPTGSQRDEITVIRRRSQQVEYREAGGSPMRIMAQVAMVMNLDKCIGCHTCSVTCKQVWTNRPGMEYVYFNNVETKPGTGYPRRYEDQEQWHGGWTLDRKGRLQLKAGGRLRAAAVHLLQPRPAVDRRLRRTVDLRLPDGDQRAAGHAEPERALDLGADRTGHEPALGQQLGRRPGRRSRARSRRPGPGRARGPGQDGVRAGVHVLPAADLRALPEPVLRRVLPVRRDVQAGRGRHRAGRPGPLPRLAVLRLGLPVQEGVLQPPHRQGREVHAVLPADRVRSADDLLGDLRGPAALPRAVPLRRRQGAGRRRHPGPAGSLPGAAVGVLRPG